MNLNNDSVRQNINHKQNITYSDLGKHRLIKLSHREQNVFSSRETNDNWLSLIHVTKTHLSNYGVFCL